jgi:hypothetical protein
MMIQPGVEKIFNLESPSPAQGTRGREQEEKEKKFVSLKPE